MDTQAYKADSLRRAVAREYGRVAAQPEGDFPFPVGRALAEAVGYEARVLDSLPRPAVAAFTGISYPVSLAGLQAGETVLDLGCGAGLDTLLMARQVGPGGRVIAVDLAPEMAARARAHAASQGMSWVGVRVAPAEKLPLPDNAVGVVIVNGIFNLCPSKEAVAAEILRVLKSGGRLLVSEIVLQPPAGEAGDFQTRSPEEAPSPEEALARWFS